ncbi:MAG: hypothetical protein ABR501_10855 [Pyrinomonadaceae bacterium]
MKEGLGRRFHRKQRHKGDTAQLAAQLAPLEEQDKLQALNMGAAQTSGVSGAIQEYGAIVINNSVGNLSQDIMEGSGVGTFLGMEPVVIVILAVMLIFIAFVAWQISLLPVE